MSTDTVPTPPGPLPRPTVLTPAQIRCLEEAKIFLSEPHPQVSTIRKVSAAFRAPKPSSSPSSSSTASASMSFQGYNPDVIHTFDIPIAIESREVLEYIGFVPEVSRVIYDRYRKRPDSEQNPDDLIAYVSGHLSALKLSQYDNMSPKDALRDIGLNQEIQGAITDPEFSQIFGTESLFYWAKDTVEINYAALLSKQKVLESYANHLLAQKEKSNGPRGHSDQSLDDQTTTPGQAVTATISMTPSDFKFPNTRVRVEADSPLLMDDHVSLYKGKAHSELKQRGAIIWENGAVNPSALVTAPGSDFNWNCNAHYWTPEKETAENYRRYVARRCPEAETCIIHIQVPRQFLNNLYQEDLWFSPEWKEYVWTCRSMVQPDEKFDRLWKPGRADLVRGPICCVGDRIFAISEDDIQMSITESYVMRLSTGRKATQWVFLQNETITQLAEQIKGKLHFILFQATRRSDE
ncbi:uncharacterized protein N7500_001641 [Penicillium coprophilum]|uniref:uncharacterized protein n=1 Tax=Penicillium coprophilum TaxID=36646 RepID=UPI0023A2C074|nr:uncharacterized protein N7500_001641 [Penicillium coprophilum]KAJ5173710.1 hypothetical protein N7500_001641 [Penicillium coprophilum]